ncbi:MAG: hypothetical protein R3E66_03380 [bacterium]
MKLGSKSAERVLSASDGNPRLIVDVLEQWHGGDQLVWTGIEFEAKPGAPIEAGAWKVTLERILAKPEYKACLIWAATLGTHVHWLDWSWLCQGAKVRIPDELVGVLVRSSLARWTDDGFDFSNGLIPEVICPVKPAAEAANMLMRLQHNQPSEARWEIIGELYFLAGEFERAMEPLERAATWRGKTTALVQKRRLLGLRWEASCAGDPH